MPDQQPAPPPDPHPGNMYVLEKRNAAELKARYPHQFPEPAWAYSWPDGWHRLVTEACAELDRLSPEGDWAQIKEKYASLRLYYSRGPLRMDLRSSGQLISMKVGRDGRSYEPTELDRFFAELEERSQATCCLCGGTRGKGRVVLFTSWYLTSCEVCEPLIRDFRNLQGRT